MVKKAQEYNTLKQKGRASNTNGRTGLRTLISLNLTTAETKNLSRTAFGFFKPTHHFLSLTPFSLSKELQYRRFYLRVEKFSQSALWRSLRRWVLFYFFVNFVKVETLMISGFWALEYLGFCCCCCCFFLRICLEKLLSVSFVFVVLFAFLLRWLSFQFVSCLRRLMMFLCRFRVVLTDLRGF